MDNAEKLLSLYDPDARVITRRKAEALVEFGNTLLLTENSQGLIVDWELFRETAPADAHLLLRSLDRVTKVFDQTPDGAGADRGFDSQKNQEELAQRGIYNGVCPRRPQQLAQRNRSWKFRKLQSRRAQTEHFQNCFLRCGRRSKGFPHRQLSVTWAVFAHNAWVLIRLGQAQAAQRALAA